MTAINFLLWDNYIAAGSGITVIRTLTYTYNRSDIKLNATQNDAVNVNEKEWNAFHPNKNWEKNYLEKESKKTTKTRTKHT